MHPRRFFAESALLPDGWARDVLFEIDATGSFAAIGAGREPGDAARLSGPAIPGMPNLHSHAFQRAMAGLTERVGQGAGGQGAGGQGAGGAAAPNDDSFWTWRQVMYGFVGDLSPDEVEIIATQLYVEMVKAGYTAVGEFHYLHHNPDGRPYDDPAEMSERIVAAASIAGIGLTHLPVLYRNGGFGGKEPAAGQRRFLHDADDYARLLQLLQKRHRKDPQFRLGIAPHSLRAVTPDLLRAGIAALDAIDATAPIHIHIAEQLREVEECIAWSKRRPIEYLYGKFDVGTRWCLVHATHMTDNERRGMAASRAVAGLCPTTEANLGDGIFPAIEYLVDDGVFGVGSDSHISVSPVEELRWLEYGQRLIGQRRNRLAGSRGGSAPSGSVGAALWRGALAGGAQALGRPIGAFASGHRADIVVLDADHPLLVGKEGDLLLDGLVFAGNENLVRDVMIGGRWRVQDGFHEAEAAARARYQQWLRAWLGAGSGAV
ncbi:MAG: formimidoylglutamate deiminase [Dongiaceae bacterium]